MIRILFSASFVALSLLIHVTTAGISTAEKKNPEPIEEEYMFPIERLKAFNLLSSQNFRLDHFQEVQAHIDKFIGIDAEKMTPEAINEAIKDPSKLILQSDSKKWNDEKREHLLQSSLKNQFNNTIAIKLQGNYAFEAVAKKTDLDLILPVFSNQFFFQRSICKTYLTTSPSFHLSEHINEYVCVLVTNFMPKSILLTNGFKITRVILAKSLAKALETMEPELNSFFKKYQTDYLSKSIDMAEFANNNFASFIQELNFLCLKLTHFLIKNLSAFRSKASKILSKFSKFLKVKGHQANHYALLQILDDFSDEAEIPYSLIKLAPKIMKNNINFNSIDHILIIAGLLRVKHMNSCEALRPFMMQKYFFDCMEMEYRNREIHNVAGECENIYSLWLNILQSVPNLCLDIRQNHEFLHLMMMKLNGAIAHHIKTSNRKVTYATLAHVAKFIIKVYHDRFERLNQFKDMIGLSEKSFLFIYRLRSIQDNEVVSIIIRKKYAVYSQIYEEFGYPSEIMAAFFKEVFDELERNRLESLDKQVSIRYFRNRIEYQCFVIAPPEYDKVCSYIGKHDAYIKLVELRHNDVIYFLLLKQFMTWLSKYDVQYNNFEQMVTRFSGFITQQVDEIALLAVQYDKLMVDPAYSKKKNSIKRTIVLAIAKFFVDFKGVPMNDILEKLLSLINEETIKIFQIRDVFDDSKSEVLESVLLGEVYKRYTDQFHAKKSKKIENEIDRFVAENKKEYDMSFWNEALPVNSLFSQAIIALTVERAIETLMKPDTNFSALLFQGYLNLLLKLTPNEKNQLQKEIPFLYGHYDNWSNELQHLFAIHQQSNLQKIMDYCHKNSQSNKNTNGCYQHAPYVNLVYKMCPESSTLQDNRNCLTRCPENFKDVGFFCEKPKVIIRKLYKTQEKCGEKCKKFGTFKFWINDCPKNYKEVLTFCVPICSYGFEDHGKSCKKIFTGNVNFYF